MLNLFTILVFLFVLLGVLGLRAFTNRARREEMVRERLTELLTQVEEEAKSVAPVEYPDESVLMGLDDYHGHFPRLHARIVRIQKGLELLGWTKNLRLRVLVLGALSFTAAALVGRMTDYPFLIAFFGGAALFASAAALLYLRAMGEWTEELGKSLPEAIDSIARICRAGVPAQTAFGLAAQNLRGALSEELRTIDRWLRLGVPLKQVLQESAHRVPLPEYRFFAVIVIISQESGGRLADTLERLAATLRERAELAGQNIRGSCVHQDRRLPRARRAHLSVHPGAAGLSVPRYRSDRPQSARLRCRQRCCRAFCDLADGSPHSVRLAS